MIAGDAWASGPVGVINDGNTMLVPIVFLFFQFYSVLVSGVLVPIL